MRSSRIILITLLLSAVILPVVIFAAEFQPIVPLPDVTPDITFGQYINRLFTLVISLSAILAVLVIIYGGFEYMTASAGITKKNGSERIQGAVTGLLLLLSVTLILQVINPCILEITVLSSVTPGTTPEECSRIPEATTPDTSASVDIRTGVVTLQSGIQIGFPGSLSSCGSLMQLCAQPGTTNYIQRPANQTCPPPTTVPIDACSPQRTPQQPPTVTSLQDILRTRTGNEGSCTAASPAGASLATTVCCTSADKTDCVVNTTGVTCVAPRSTQTAVCISRN